MGSQMFNHLSNEFDRLKSTILDEESFDSNYQTIVRTIIPDLNRQCKEYVRKSARAIRVDVADELSRETDFESYKELVKTHFANGTMNTNSKPLRFRVPELKESIGICSFELEPINQAYLLIGEDAKKYSKAVYRIEEYCDNFLNNFSGFEMRMVDYRAEIFEEMRRLIPQLVEEYEAHLFRLRNAKAMGMEGEKTYMFKDGKKCGYGTSIAMFVNNAIRTILGLDEKI